MGTFRLTWQFVLWCDGGGGEGGWVTKLYANAGLTISRPAASSVLRQLSWHQQSASFARIWTLKLGVFLFSGDNLWTSVPSSGRDNSFKHHTHRSLKDPYNKDIGNNNRIISYIANRSAPAWPWGCTRPWCCCWWRGRPPCRGWRCRAAWRAWWAVQSGATPYINHTCSVIRYFVLTELIMPFLCFASIYFNTSKYLGAANIIMIRRIRNLGHLGSFRSHDLVIIIVLWEYKCDTAC